MATDSPIGTKIRRARERKRMSQDELAAAVGVSRSAVNAWENDRAYPRNSVGALEDILGIDLYSPPAPASHDQRQKLIANLKELTATLEEEDTGDSDNHESTAPVRTSPAWKARPA